MRTKAATLKRNSSRLKTYVCLFRLVTISLTHRTQLYRPTGLNTTLAFTWCMWLQTPCSLWEEASREALCKEKLYDPTWRICLTVFAAVVKSCRLLSSQQHSQGARDLFCLIPSSAICHLTNSNCGLWIKCCAKVSPSKWSPASCFSPLFFLVASPSLDFVPTAWSSASSQSAQRFFPVKVWRRGQRLRAKSQRLQGVMIGEQRWLWRTCGRVCSHSPWGWNGHQKTYSGGHEPISENSHMCSGITFFRLQNNTR